jgi:dTDP-4-amino-4,6-dideoxygalactose transaminase
VQFTKIEAMKQADINCVFHYVSFHRSIKGHKVYRSIGDLPITSDLSKRLVRLHVWVNLINSIVNQTTIKCLNLE